MTEMASLTAEEVARIVDTVEAWGGTIDDLGSHDVAFRLASRVGLGYLDENATVVGQVALALPGDHETTNGWVEAQDLPEGMWLGVDPPLDSEDAEDALLWLYIDRTSGDSPAFDVRPIVADLSRSWFALQGGDRVGVLSAVLTALDLTAEEVDGSLVRFGVGDADGIAYVKDSGDRARIHVTLGHQIDPDEARAWIAQQPTTGAGYLRLLAEEGGTQHHLLFTTERPLDPDKIGDHDAYASEAQRFFAAWQARDIADLAAVDGGLSSPVKDPRAIEPANAWVLYGDEASFPSEQELASASHKVAGQVYDYLWTAAKQTQPGDLLFLYFVHERKAIHFVARAAVAAWYSGELEVAANARVRPTQWWTCITPPVPITPIPFAQLKDAFHGDLVMRGRSGRYIPPATVTRLIEIIGEDAITPELEAVLRQPVGLADLPEPQQMTFEQWRVIAAGELPLEAKVEEHLVEPLLRLALRDRDDLRPQKRYRVAGGIADYAILSDTGAPCAIIEVKVAVRKRPNASWSDSPDFLQTRRYADALNCPSVLIDSHYVHLIAPHADAPHATIERRTATAADLDALTEHISGERLPP